MADYIDREKVIELIDYHQEEYFEAETYFGLLKEDFMQLPSADVAPVVHGRWILDDPQYLLSHCSECHGFNSIGYKWEYCPNCGAKMDGE